jgi:hypothetical protein
MSALSISIECRKCHNKFQPDLKERGYWICPECQGKNPNLRRHYRSVADLYILWLIFSIIVMVVRFGSVGVDWKTIITLPFLMLLLVTIIMVYRAREPWTDRGIKRLIWLVFGIALGAKVVQFAQMSFRGEPKSVFVGSFGLVFTAILIYLFWLHSQSKKYMPREQITGQQGSPRGSGVSSTSTS